MSLDNALNDLLNMSSDNLTYYLMNKDETLLEFKIEGKGILQKCVEKRVLSTLPVWIQRSSIDAWVKNRNAAKHRKHIKKLLAEYCASEPEGFIRLTHCLSLNDTLWVKSSNENITWKEVSLYRNKFDDVISKLAFDGTGLYGLRMSTTIPEVTTGGTYDKCWTNYGNSIYLVKAGTTGARNAGLEPYCEVLASQVFSRLCPGSVEYTLSHFNGRVVTMCEIFTDETFGYRSYGTLKGVENTLPEIIEFYNEIGELDRFSRMLVADGVTLNMDRHLGNFGFKVFNHNFEVAGMSPVFDFNMSFVPYAEFGIDFPIFDKYLRDRGPALGGDYVELPKQLLTPAIRADLINLKQLDLVVETDDKFTDKRLKFINEIKDVQIDRILGRSRQFSFVNKE